MNNVKSTLLNFININDEEKTAEMCIEAFMITPPDSDIRDIVVKNIPKKYRSAAICEYGYFKGIYIINDIPLEFQTTKMALHAIKCGRNAEGRIAAMAPHLFTREFFECLGPIAPQVAALIPRKNWNTAVSMVAMSEFSNLYDTVPEELKTRELHLHMVKCNPNHIKYIDVKYMSVELYLAMLEGEDKIEEEYRDILGRRRVGTYYKCIYIERPDLFEAALAIWTARKNNVGNVQQNDTTDAGNNDIRMD